MPAFGEFGVTELPVSAFFSEWASPDAERELIERAKFDRGAFAQLYRRHYGAIAGYVHRRVGDTHTTEDLVAEVFVIVLRSLRGYRHRGVPFRGWVYRIATNVVNRWARRQRVRSMFHGHDHDVAEHVVAKEASGDGSGSLDESGVSRRAMLKLSAKHQAVLALHYLEGLSVEEVAGVLGCRIGTVKSRLSRGRVALGELLLKGR